jgi:hypothetical protein
MAISSNQKVMSQDAGLILNITGAIGSILESTEQEIYFYPGEMILADGWLVTGEIAINIRDGNDLINIILTEDEEIVLEPDEIDIIKLYDERNGYTQFEKLPGRRLFSRLVFEKNESFKVYDSGYRPFTDNLRGRVFIETENEVKDLWSFWTGSSEKDLINYINDRDNQNYRRRDFETVQNIFDKL